MGREESIGRKYKGVTIAQWDDRLQNGSFVNRIHRKLLLSAFLEALHPALLGLTAGWLVGCTADKLKVNVWIFKNCCSFKC